MNISLHDEHSVRPPASSSSADMLVAESPACSSAGEQDIFESTAGRNAEHSAAIESPEYEKAEQSVTVGPYEHVSAAFLYSGDSTASSSAEDMDAETAKITTLALRRLAKWANSPSPGAEASKKRPSQAISAKPQRRAYRPTASSISAETPALPRTPLPRGSRHPHGLPLE